MSDTARAPRSVTLTRRYFLKQSGAASAGIWSSPLLVSASAASGSRVSGPSRRSGKSPNVVVFLVDQQRADMAGCYGNNFCRTPWLDRLARRGVQFTGAYCGFPQCSPARASLMTGLYPNRTGIGIQSDYRMLGDRTLERLDKSLPSIGTIFKSAGYETGYFGKWHLSPQEPPDDIADYGFETFSPLPEFRSKRYPFKHAAERHGLGPIAGLCETNAMWRGDLARAAITFIDRCCKQDAPFLLFYSDYRPHPPYFVPKEEFEKFAPTRVELWPNLHDDLKTKPLTHRLLRRRIMGHRQPSDTYWKSVIQHYSAMVSATDHQMGLVYGALERNNVLQDTIVLFISDHGDTCGAHGFLSKGVVAYQELIRIPMVISWPGHFAAGHSCEEPVSLVDILPTLVQATGLGSESRPVDGRCLVPLLTGQKPPDWRKYLLIMHHGNMYGLCTMRAVVGKRFKLVHYAYDTGELYDLREDPWEMNNLIDSPGSSQVVQGMSEQLGHLMKEAGDTRVYIL